MMRIIVAGSRNVTEQQVFNAIQWCRWVRFATKIVSGTAKGADSFGEKWAELNHIEVERFPAEWGKYGKRAGPVRNEVMAQHADGLIAVWDGKSAGTRNMISLAQQYGLRVMVYRTDNNTITDIEPRGDSMGAWETLEERAAILEYCNGMDRVTAEQTAAKEYS